MKLVKFNYLKANQKKHKEYDKNINIKKYTMLLCFFVFVGSIIYFTYSRFSVTTTVKVIHAKVGQFVHRLQFDANGGDVDPTYKDIRDKNVYGELPIARRNGYTFNGWWSEQEDGDEVTSLNIMENTDVTIYAHWNINSYNFIIKPNGGEWNGHTADQPYTLEYDEQMHIEDPIRTGYSFKGWTIEGIGSTYDVDTKEFKMGYENASIEANWEINKYNLTIDYDNDDENYDKDLEYQKQITIEDPEKEGHTFTGWEVASGDDISTLINGDYTYTQPAKDIKLTATWQANIYKWIVFHNKMDLTGESYILSDTEEGQDEYGKTFTGTLQNYTGFHNPALQEKTIKVEEEYPPTKNLINYDYDRKQYKLTIKPNGGTYNNSENETKMDLYYQQEEEINDPIRQCYTFDNWIKSGNSTIQNRILKMGDEDTTLEANWNKIKYLITFNGNGGIISDTSKINQEIECGDSLTLLPSSSISRDGYIFDGWYKDELGNEKIEEGFIPTETRIIYAHWIPIVYTISYDLDGGSLDSNNPEEYTIESDDIILKKPTKDEYVFKGWSGTGLEGNENKEVIIEKGSIGNRNYKANWKYKTYQIELDSQDGSDGTEQIFERYNYGYYLDDESVNEITSINNPINVPTKKGYNFDGYYTEQNAEGLKFIDKYGKLTSNARNDYFNADGKLYANWDIITYNLSYNLDGGTVNQDNPDTYTVESNNITLNNPEKVGYDFIGWSGTYLEGNNNIVVNINNGSTDDRNYTANWELGLYEITLDKQDGNNGTDKIYEKYSIGYYFNNDASDEIINNIEIPTRVGYTFEGYYTEKNGNGTKLIDNTGKLSSGMTNTNFVANSNLYAYWSVKTITCNQGQYLQENSETCSECPKGYYCSGGTYTYTGNEQGKTGCGEGKYNDLTGQNSISACKEISAGCYGTNAESNCPAECQGKTKYSLEGQASCSTVSDGYYTTGCDSSNNKCSGESECSKGYFCINGESTACAEGSYTSSTGQSTCTACQGNTTSGTGKTSCDIECSNALGVSTWTTATWSNNSVSNICNVNSCDNGYTKDTTNNKCNPSNYTITFDNNYLDNELFEAKALNVSNYSSAGTALSNRKISEDLSAKSGIITEFTMSEGSNGGVYINPPTKLVSGNVYTWSVYVKTSTNKTLKIGDEQNGIINSANITTSWQRLTHTFTASDNQYWAFVFHSDSGWQNGEKIYIHSLEITEDNKLNVTNQSKIYNTELGTLPTPSREGYTFDGWYTEAVGGDKISTTTKVPASNTTYYAHWTVNKYYLDLNGYLDGSSEGNITNYGSADVIVNGEKKGEDKTDFYEELPYGSYYEINDIKANTGRTYEGVYSGSATGTITKFTSVYLKFSTNSITCEQGQYLPSNTDVCSDCSTGSYCEGGTWTYDGTEKGKTSCATLASGSYTNSAAKSTQASDCFIPKDNLSGKYVATAYQEPQTCNKGNYCPGDKVVYYGQTGGQTACGDGKYNDLTGQSSSSACKYITAGCYGTSAEKACPAECEGKTKYSLTGQASCSTVSEGYYTTGCDSSNNRCTGQSECNAGNYCINGESKVCINNSYSESGASACSACQGKSTNGTGKASCDYDCSNAEGVSTWELATWENNTVSNHCKIESCNDDYTLDTTNNKCNLKSVTCSSGQYLPANSTSCSTCPSGSYCGGGTYTKSSSDQGRTYCTSLGSNYQYSSEGSTSSTDCYMSVSGGYYKTSAYGNSTTTCGSGTYVGSHSSYYGSSDSCNNCTSLGSNYQYSSSGSTSSTDCYMSVSGGYYKTSAYGNNTSICSSGTYVGSHYSYYGSSDSCINCTNLGSNYQYSSSGSTSSTDCYMSVSGGYYKTSAYGNSTSTCGSGTYVGSHSSYYGSSDSCNNCTSLGSNYQYSSSGSTSSTDCYMYVSGGYYKTSAYGNNTSTCSSGTYVGSHYSYYGYSDSCNNCTSLGSNYQYSSSGSTSSTDCYMYVSGGYYKTSAYGNNTSSCSSGYTSDSHYSYYGSSDSSACYSSSVYCSSGTYLPSYSTSCSTCPSGSYCTGGTFSYSSSDQGRYYCSSLGSGYTSYSGATASTSCYLSVSAGQYKTSSTGTSTSYCSAGTFKGSHNSYYGSSDSCTACAKGSYTSSSGQSSCTACQGNTTSGTGSTYCNASCSNATGVSTWTTASWSNNYVSNECKVSTCTSGYTIDSSNNKCVSSGCTYNYYSPTNTSNIFGSRYMATYQCNGTTGTIQKCYDNNLIYNGTSKEVATSTCTSNGFSSSESCKCQDVTVSFNLNGGNGSVSPVTLNYNESLYTKFNNVGRTFFGTATITKETADYLGFNHSTLVFDGWYTSSSGGTKILNNTRFTSNQTVYAHWRTAKLSYSYSFDSYFNSDKYNSDKCTTITGKQKGQTWGTLCTPATASKSYCSKKGSSSATGVTTKYWYKVSSNVKGGGETSDVEYTSSNKIKSSTTVDGDVIVKMKITCDY